GGSVGSTVGGSSDCVRSPGGTRVPNGGGTALDPSDRASSVPPPSPPATTPSRPATTPPPPAPTAPPPATPPPPPPTPSPAGAGFSFRARSLKSGPNALRSSMLRSPQQTVMSLPDAVSNTKAAR